MRRPGDRTILTGYRDVSLNNHFVDSSGLDDYKRTYLERQVRLLSSSSALGPNSIA
jgi:hypothetical protein